MTQLLLLLTLVLSYLPSAVFAPGQITVETNQAELQFPNQVTFSLKTSGDSEIQEIMLEYSVDELTCGIVLAKAFPDFTPGTQVETSFTWDMRQSGSLPPGAVIKWSWLIKDASGAEFVTESQSIIWLDDTHAWQSRDNGMLTLHWYEGSQSFADQLLASGQEALTTLQNTAGVTPSQQVHFYIYANNTDMKDAILYEPDWAGGLAYPENNIVIIGAGVSDLDWGKLTVKHELTHVLIGHLTFSCLGSVPTWLNEGLAMVGEGGLDSTAQAALDSAITEDTIFSIRSLGGSFSADPDKANLSYDQSYSVVNFMINTGGQEKMLTLLSDLQKGETIDDALRANYGYDVDGLEDAWRADVGASPRKGGSTAPTPTTPPTAVPTYEPVSGLPIVRTAEPTLTLAPTSTLLPTSPPAQRTPTPVPAAAESTSIPLVIGLAAGAAVLLILLIIFFLSRRKKSQKPQ
jgi:hypothetical protein